MTQPAKVYVCWVAAVGSVAIGAALSECQFNHPLRFPVYFALAFLASTIKIRFPNITGSFSCSSLFAVLAIAELDRSEAVLIAIGAAAGQTLINVREKPNMVQLVFNIAALGISTSAGFGVKVIASSLGARPVVAVSCAAAAFYVLNSLIVAAVLALLHAQTVRRLWSAWIRWTTPAFLASGAAGVALFAVNPEFHWQAVVLLVPAAVLFQIWYRRLIAATHGTHHESLMAPAGSVS